MKRYIFISLLFISSLAYGQAYKYRVDFKGATVKTYQTTVSSTTATALFTPTATITDSIYYSPSFDLYIGSVGVTTSVGFLIEEDLYISPDGSFTGTMYGIAAAGSASATVYIMELSK